MSQTRHKAARSHRRVTINEVAERAGVSIKTVSRVLNRERNVRGATRDKVLQVAQELSYAPHISARRLASQRSFIVALLYRDDDVNHYIPDIQHGALDVCRERSYNLLLHPCVRSIEEAGVEVHDLARHALIDGFIVTPPLADSRSLMSEMKETGVPFVRISQLHRGELSPSISVGDRNGAYKMTEYLASLGHERIGFIVGDRNQGASSDRLAGFEDAVRELRLETRSAWTAQGDFTFESGLRGATAILSSKVRPTAIFARLPRAGRSIDRRLRRHRDVAAALAAAHDSAAAHEERCASRDRNVVELSRQRRYVARKRRAPERARHSRKCGAAGGLAPRARLRAPRRLGMKRVLGPVMARIAAAHVLAHVDVGVLPEAREVASHLQRPMRRRQ
jgi:LacI family transcriptional regulator